MLFKLFFSARAHERCITVLQQQDGPSTVFDDSLDLERLAAIQQHIAAEIEGATPAALCHCLCWCLTSRSFAVAKSRLLQLQASALDASQLNQQQRSASGKAADGTAGSTSATTAVGKGKVTPSVTVVATGLVSKSTILVSSSAAGSAALAAPSPAVAAVRAAGPSAGQQLQAEAKRARPAAASKKTQPQQHLPTAGPVTAHVPVDLVSEPSTVLATASGTFSGNNTAAGGSFQNST